MNVIKQRSYITLDNNNIWVFDDTLTDSIYYDGKFIGTAIARQVEFKVTNAKTYIGKEIIYNRQTYVNNAWVTTLVGTFIITDIQRNDTEYETTITALDYMLKAHIDYSPGDIFPCSLQAVYEDVANQCGLTLGTTTLDINGDFMVDSNQFEGRMCLDVIKAIAEITGNYAHINSNDELILNFHSDNPVATITSGDYSTLENKRDSTPITVLTLENSAITGENWGVEWAEGVELYGNNEYLISDNLFAYTQEKRSELAPAILNKIQGWAYAGFVANDCYMQSLQCGDLVTIQNLDGTTDSSIVLETVYGSEKSEISAPSFVKASINYWNKKEAWRQTEVIVDKALGNISLITQQIDDIETDLGNMYTRDEVNTLIANAETGLTNTFSKTGGVNLLRNSAPYFGNGTEWEYWNGTIGGIVYPDSISGKSLVLYSVTSGEEAAHQNISIPAGTFTLSFKFEKTTATATATIKFGGRNILINADGSVTNLAGEVDDDIIVDNNSISTTITVESTVRQSLSVALSSNEDEHVYIYDLMLNVGSTAMEWTQNVNETYSTTVNISKGVEVSSPNSFSKTRMDTDGFRILNNSGTSIFNVSTSNGEATGIYSTNLTIDEGGTAQVAGLFVKKYDEEVWISGL